MSAARLEREVMAQPEAERLSYALDLLRFYLDPLPAFFDGLARLGLRVTPQEARILHALDRRRGRMVSLQALQAAAMADRAPEDWSAPASVYARIAALRTALRRAGLPVEITAWSGVGYRLTAPEGFDFTGGAHGK